MNHLIHIKKIEERLNNEIKKQSKVNSEFKELKKLKQNLMSGIVNNMDTAKDIKSIRISTMRFSNTDGRTYNTKSFAMGFPKVKQSNKKNASLTYTKLQIETSGTI